MITKTKDILVRHYGSNVFERSRVFPISDAGYAGFNKPAGGLWTSPVGSDNGWAQWCLDSGFHVEALEKSVDLRFTGRLLVIDSVEDLDQLDWADITATWRKSPTNCLYGPLWVPRFEGVQLKADAIHLTEEGQWRTRHSRPRSLYGWDCETVFVMNPDSVRQVAKVKV